MGKKRWLMTLLIAILFYLIIFLLSLNAASKVEPKQPKDQGPYVYASNSMPINVVSKSLASVLPSYPYEELRERIIKCESGGNPKACNGTFGCRGGMGLWQFIAGTWNGTIARMEKDGTYLPERCYQRVTLPVSAEKTEAVFDYECNYLAGSYLLLKDGSRHWGFNGADWGSWKCWN